MYDIPAIDYDIRTLDRIETERKRSQARIALMQEVERRVIAKRQQQIRDAEINRVKEGQGFMHAWSAFRNKQDAERIEREVITQRIQGAERQAQWDAEAESGQYWAATQQKAMANLSKTGEMVNLDPLAQKRRIAEEAYRIAAQDAQAKGDIDTAREYERRMRLAMGPQSSVVEQATEQDLSSGLVKRTVQQGPEQPQGILARAAQYAEEKDPRRVASMKALAGGLSSFAQDIQQPETRQQAVADWKQANRGMFMFSAGVGGIMQSLGGALMANGKNGQWLVDAGTRIQSEATRGLPAAKSKGEQMSDAIWSSSPFLIGAMGLAVGAMQGAAALGLGTIGTWLLGSLMGTAASRPFESATEAGQAYLEAKNRGASHEVAKEAYDSVFKGNMRLAGWDAVQIVVAFAPMPAKVIGKASTLLKVVRIGGKTAIVGLTEGGEEVYQDMLQKKAQGDPFYWNLELWDEDTKLAFAVGTIMGVGFGAGGDILTTGPKVREIAPETYDAAIENAKDKPQDVAVAEAILEVAKENPQAVESIVAPGVETQGTEGVVAYHGSTEIRESFDTSDRQFGMTANARGDNIGAFFTTSRSGAKKYGPKVTAVRLSIRNPKVFASQDEFRQFLRDNTDYKTGLEYAIAQGEDGWYVEGRNASGEVVDSEFHTQKPAAEKSLGQKLTREASQGAQQQLIAQGYDGVQISDPYGDKSETWYIAFKPEQIRTSQQLASPQATTVPAQSTEQVTAQVTEQVPQVTQEAGKGDRVELAYQRGIESARAELGTETNGFNEVLWGLSAALKARGVDVRHGDLAQLFFDDLVSQPVGVSLADAVKAINEGYFKDGGIKGVVKYVNESHELANPSQRFAYESSRLSDAVRRATGLMNEKPGVAAFDEKVKGQIRGAIKEAHPDWRVNSKQYKDLAAKLQQRAEAWTTKYNQEDIANAKRDVEAQVNQALARLSALDEKLAWAKRKVDIAAALTPSAPEVVAAQQAITDKAKAIAGIRSGVMQSAASAGLSAPQSSTPQVSPQPAPDTSGTIIGGVEAYDPTRGIFEYDPTESIKRLFPESNIGKIAQAAGKLPFGEEAVGFFNPTLTPRESLAAQTVQEHGAVANDLVYRVASGRKAYIGNLAKSLFPEGDAVKHFQVDDMGIQHAFKAKRDGAPMGIVDVLENPQNYELDAPAQEFVKLWRKVHSQAITELDKRDIKVNQKFYEEGGGYFPRMVRSAYGEDVNVPRVKYRKPRSFATQEEGIYNEIGYTIDPIHNINGFIDETFRIIAAHDLKQVVDSVGRTAKDSVPVSLRIARDETVKRHKVMLRAYSAAQRVKRGEKLPSATIRSIEGIDEAAARLVEGKDTKALKAMVDESRRLAIRARKDYSVALDRARGPKLGSFERGTIHPAFKGQWFSEETAKVLDALAPKAASDAWRKVQSVNEAMRTVKANFDFSPGTIQGLNVLARAPHKWGEVTAKSFEWLFKPENAPKWFAKHGDIISRHPDIVQGTHEYYAGQEVIKTKLGKPGRAIAKAMTPFENYFTNWGDAARVLMAEALEPSFVKAGTPERLGTYINRMTGVMDTRALGVSGKQRAFESLMLFAPRYTRASVAYIGTAMEGGVMGAEARKTIALLIGAGTLFWMGMQKAMGEEPAWPNSPNFWTVKMGNRRVGMGGFMYSFIRLLADSYQSIASEGGNAPSDFKEWDRTNPIINFLSKRTSVLWRAVLTVRDETDFMGYPIEGFDEWAHYFMVEMMAPISIQEQLTGANEDAPSNRLGVAAAELFGLRTFPENEYYALADKYAQAAYGKDWNELSKPTKAGSYTRSPEQKRLLQMHPDLKAAYDAQKDRASERWKAQHDLLGDKNISRDAWAREMFGKDYKDLPKEYQKQVDEAIAKG